jgi:hypothetical protein
MFTEDHALRIVKIHQNFETDEFIEQVKELLPSLDEEVIRLLDTVISYTLDEVTVLLTELTKNFQDESIELENIVELLDSKKIN